MKKICFWLSCSVLLFSCVNKNNDTSEKAQLETYSQERFDAIVSQMDLVQELLLNEKEWGDIGKREYERLADSLLYLVEHSDDPTLRVGTRAFVYSLEGSLFDMGALPYLVGESDLMSEIPYRWTLVSNNEDSLIMEMEIPLIDESGNWIDMDITYYKEFEKDSTPTLFSICISRKLLVDTNQFYLLFVNTTDTTDVFVKRIIQWKYTYHTMDEDNCYIRVPLDVVLLFIEKTDGIVIKYNEGKGVMHSTYVFKEQYLDFLKNYCRDIKSYLKQ